MDSTVVFKPRSSPGWLSLAAVGLLLVVIGLSSGLPLLGTSQAISGLISMTLCLALGVIPLALAAYFPSMRYEVDATYLTLIYGPVLRYEIPLVEIRGMRRRDLSLSLVSAFRMPGVALFSVPYSDVGPVKMCASAAVKGILLVETDHGLYGLTPEDETGLVQAVRARMERLR